MENKASVTRRINHRAKEWHKSVMDNETAQKRFFDQISICIENNYDAAKSLQDNKEWATSSLRHALKSRARETVNGKMHKHFTKSAVKWVCCLRNIRAFENMLVAVAQ